LPDLHNLIFLIHVTLIAQYKFTLANVSLPLNTSGKTCVDSNSQALFIVAKSYFLILQVYTLSNVTWKDYRISNARCTTSAE